MMPKLGTPGCHMAPTSRISLMPGPLHSLSAISEQSAATEILLSMVSLHIPTTKHYSPLPDPLFFYPERSHQVARRTEPGVCRGSTLLTVVLVLFAFVSDEVSTMNVLFFFKAKSKKETKCCFWEVEIVFPRRREWGANPHVAPRAEGLGPKRTRIPDAPTPAFPGSCD